MADKPADNNKKFYPAVGFHFRVVFGSDKDDGIDTRFQSVSGLSVEMETENKSEGGETRYAHTLPLRAKYPSLVLKRGFLKDSTQLLAWCNNAFQNFDIKPKDIIVTLLNEDHEPLKTWNVVHAWPKKWAVSDFNAEQNSLLIETLELQYQYFTVS